MHVRVLAIALGLLLAPLALAGAPLFPPRMSGVGEAWHAEGDGGVGGGMFPFWPLLPIAFLVVNLATHLHAVELGVDDAADEVRLAWDGPTPGVAAFRLSAECAWSESGLRCERTGNPGETLNVAPLGPYAWVAQWTRGDGESSDNARGYLVPSAS